MAGLRKTVNRHSDGICCVCSCICCFCVIVLNKKAGRKSAGEEDLQAQLGNELADVIHYTMAIAALNEIDMNDVIIAKDKDASVKYNHRTNLEQFIINRRTNNRN